MTVYSILHRRAGKEISMHERKRIDAARNVCSMLVHRIRREDDHDRDSDDCKAARERVHALTPDQFDATGVVVISYGSSNIRIDRR